MAVQSPWDVSVEDLKKLRDEGADLVLLDANPLTDIRNTRRISVVIANGRVYDAAARALLLKRLEDALKH